MIKTSAFRFFVVGSVLVACERRSDDAQTHVSAQPVTQEATSPETRTVSHASNPTVKDEPKQDGPSAEQGEGHCARLCRLTAELNCPGQDGCLQACDEMRDMPICEEEMNRVLECMLAQPAKHWTCGDEGMAEIEEGHCEREQAGVLACIRQAAAAR